MSSFSSACDLAQYYESSCPTKKFGRITAVAFVEDCYDFTDPTDQQEWFDLTCSLVSGEPKGVIIHSVTGDMSDGGAPISVAGRATQKTRTVSYDFTVTYAHDFICENRDFYNSLRDSFSYKFWFVTSDPKTNKSLLWTSNANVSVTPTIPITDTLESIIEYKVTVAWNNDFLPSCYEVPKGIFDSYEAYETLRGCLTCTPAICTTC